jgi:hypothetical protein
MCVYLALTTHQRCSGSLVGQLVQHTLDVAKDDEDDKEDSQEWLEVSH